MNRSDLFDVIRSIKGSGLTQAEVERVNAVLDGKQPRKTSQRGIDLIKEFEGFSSYAYLCPANVWTIGYGHTKGVKRGDKVTAPEAEQLLRDDLAYFEAKVAALCPVTTQSQYDALVSFCYNLGEGNLESSTLRKKHNAGDYAGAAKEFARWNKAGGKVLAGLTRRRAAEAALYAAKS